MKETLKEKGIPTRFITVRVFEEDFKKYKAYLQYIVKKNIQDDIREYIRSRGELVDEKTMNLTVSSARRKAK
jgi:hypothetical protein